MKENYFSIKKFIGFFAIMIGSLGGFLLINIPLATALGATPAVFDFPNILPTTTIQRTVHISRGGLSKIKTFKVTIDGNGAPFIQLPRQKIIFAGEAATAPVVFIIKPTTAPPGSYSATLHITPQATPQQLASLFNNDSSAATRLLSAVAVKIKFSITDSSRQELEITAVHLDRLASNATGQTTVRPKVTVYNSGNEPLTIDSLQILSPNQDFTWPAISLKPTVTIDPYGTTVLTVADTVTLPSQLYPPLTVNLWSSGKIITSYANATWPGAPTINHTTSWWQEIFSWFKK